MRGFDFHPRFSNMEFSHIAFIDDLFLISAATEHSFHLVKDIIAEYGSLSGLRPKAMCS